LVVFWKFANTATDSQDGEEHEQPADGRSRLLFTRGYSVFNAVQVGGYTAPAEPDTPMLERIEQADAFFASAGAVVRHGGNRAYYSTLAHEHAHWTSHAGRCERQLGKRFGDNAYAAEELIAELGAAFACAHLGLSTEPREDHAQYIQSWLRVLKADKRAVFTAASYIAECAAHLKVGSIQRRLNAIAEAHKALGLESPTSAGVVRNTLKGIKRTLGTAPVQKAPALTKDIRAMVGAADSGLIGARDRAVILLGFAGAFRRSEVVGLDVEDLDFNHDGLTVTLRRSKNDQDGQGRKVGIPYGANPETCPVRNLRAWLEASCIEAGAVFRSVNRHGQVKPGRLSGIDVARIVKKLVERAGLDATSYAGHSIRAGHATSAAIAGASERSIMNQTGHRSVQMVRRYIRDGNLFRDNSAGKLGL
jgi:integrase